MNITLIGLDLAKNVIQVCGVNQAGKVGFNRQVRRRELLTFLAQYPQVSIAMEACPGSNYWGRTLTSGITNSSPARQTLRQGQQERPQ